MTGFDRYVEELERDGVCVLRGLLDPALMEVWARAFAAVFEDRSRRPGGLAPREQARYYLTLPWEPPFSNPDVFAHPAILAVLERVLESKFVMVQLGADTPLYGSQYQPIHRDFPPLFSEEFVTPLYAVAVNVPLVEVTKDRAPFEMARGTHRIPKAEGLTRLAREAIATPTAETRIEVGTPLAWNPSVPGAKIEDTVVRTRDDVEIVTNDPAWPTFSCDGRPRPDLLVKP